MKKDYFRVEQVVRCKKPLFRGSALVRVAKRKKHQFWSGPVYRYFVTALDAPYGHGVWCQQEDLDPLSPLEILAMEASKFDDLGAGD